MSKTDYENTLALYWSALYIHIETDALQTKLFAREKHVLPIAWVSTTKRFVEERPKTETRRKKELLQGVVRISGSESDIGNILYNESAFLLLQWDQGAIRFEAHDPGLERGGGTEGERSQRPGVLQLHAEFSWNFFGFGSLLRGVQAGGRILLKVKTVCRGQATDSANNAVFATILRRLMRFPDYVTYSTAAINAHNVIPRSSRLASSVMFARMHHSSSVNRAGDFLLTLSTDNYWKEIPFRQLRLNDSL
ncbi:hypothetical protein CAPTEDRAFT_194651 [Capitella teleta]|uniref:Uncharacterized protein n=1 Tax=Capitella teleta TaxID=283909 RepID=R7V189_CAPTE|nr:hypothetical protein CAPTEDRAFT_194651 [Capitella teleta]|eukprot:ELU09977.1 hypothetical protein CAPTEDRAFT_194651 [Capitella teleta]